MSYQERRGELPVTSRLLPRGLLRLLWVLLGAGVLTFLLEATGPNRLRAWQIFLVNWLFWSGMAQGGLVFAATYDVVRAKWGGAVKHLAQGLGAFLPVSFVLFFLLLAGRQVLFPWVNQPIPEKQAWLNTPFLFARDGIGLSILYGLGFAYLYYSLRVDLGRSVTHRGDSLPRISALFSRGWRGLEEEQRRSRRALAILSPIFLFTYATVFSLIGFDLVMALDPSWYSTLFGAYFFVSSFYLGLAAIAILAVLARRRLGLEEQIGRKQFHDLGKILFGFCLVAGDFFWSQFVVIWYGNLPEETPYLILRGYEMPWAPLTWTVLLVSFIIPFLLLLSRRVKESPRTLLPIALLILIGMWIERYILVVPSLWHRTGLPLGWIELLITGGFLAAVALSYSAFLSAFPVPPVSGVSHRSVSLPRSDEPGRSSYTER